ADRRPCAHQTRARRRRDQRPSRAARARARPAARGRQDAGFRRRRARIPREAPAVVHRQKERIMDALAIARACADAMWADDVASRSLGIELISVEPGHAVLAMEVAEKMVNGHDICHGGYIFTLADSAFAFACNTYNERTVAQQCAITFVAAAQR